MMKIKRPSKMNADELRAVPVIQAREAAKFGAQFYEDDDLIHAPVDGEFYRFGRDNDGKWFRWAE